MASLNLSIFKTPVWLTSLSVVRFSKFEILNRSTQKVKNNYQPVKIFKTVCDRRSRGRVFIPYWVLGYRPNFVVSSLRQTLLLDYCFMSSYFVSRTTDCNHLSFLLTPKVPVSIVGLHLVSRRC